MREHGTYIVQPSGARWAVCLKGKTLGVFEERTEAAQATVVVTEAPGRSGRASEVLTQEGGETPMDWEVEKDVYSPL